MVKSVTSYSGNGMRDFLIQRFSAVYITFFLMGLLIYLFVHHVTDYYLWHALFQTVGMRISTVLFFISLIVHTQIGLWSIITDYLKDPFTRLVFMVLTWLTLAVSFIWGNIVLWSS